MKPLSELQANWPVLSPLLDAALEQPAAERRSWLAALAADDAIKHALARLMDMPPGVETGDFMRTVPKLGSRAWALIDSEAAVDASTPKTGDQVGPWRLLSVLGEGGMGHVWLAERADGAYQRQVALKLPRISWASGLVERMARERDILATLEHPRIARLYDAGVDALGRPWLALEHVQGQPIDHHAREKALTARQRVQLLRQVCEAVAYAHSRLVIHRDIKPSNVLVDGQGQVMLLDFGIAKLVAGDLPGASLFTEVAGRVLTLGYASPEQVRGDTLTTATDVYSLGVLAYELLTGSRPYRLQRGSAAELEEAILLVDPVPASSTTEDQPLRRALRGDLDAILNKALKKDLVHRYPSVDALSQDLQRHLANLPVSAQADAWLYRAAKLVQRHRVPVAAGALASAALIGGSGLALWQADRARASARQADIERAQAVAQGRIAQEATMLAQQQRQIAVAAAEQARSAAEQARVAAEQAASAAVAERLAAAAAREQGAVAAAVQQFMTALFKANTARQPNPQAARATTARELLDIGAERVGTDLAGQPAARHEVALLLSTLYSELGLEQRSLDMARHAYAAAQQASPAGSPRQLAAMSRMLEQVRLVGQPTELRAWVVQAENQLLRLPARPDPERIDLLCRLALIHELNQPARAWELGSQATALARLLGEAALLQRSLGVQARAGVRLQRDAQAEVLLTEALQLAARSGARWSFEQAQMRAALAEAQSRQLRYTAAAATLGDALAAAERDGGADHMDATQLRLRLATPLVVLGQVSQAAALLERVRDTLRAQGSERQLVLSLALSDLGIVRTELGQLAAADDALAEALMLRDRLRPESDAAAAVRENLSHLRLAQGRSDEAESLLQESEAIRSRLGQRAGEAAWTRLVLHRVALARARGRTAEAQDWVRRWHDASGQTDGKGIGGLRRALTAATLALDAAQPADAARQLQAVQRALAPWRAGGPLVALEVPYRIQCGRLARQLGAGVEVGERQFASAERMLETAVQGAAPARRELLSARQEQPTTMAAAGERPALCPTEG
jgi:hypothetical protein